MPRHAYWRSDGSSPKSLPRSTGLRESSWRVERNNSRLRHDPPTHTRVRDWIERLLSRFRNSENVELLLRRGLSFPRFGNSRNVEVCQQRFTSKLSAVSPTNTGHDHGLRTRHSSGHDHEPRSRLLSDHEHGGSLEHDHGFYPRTPTSLVRAPANPVK
jgi:hypothetical protein